jgi:uncharacterized protein (TIGR03435 family)
MPRKLLGAAFWTTTSCWLITQSTPTPLTFEVASIKRSAADAVGMMLQMQPGGGLRATNLTLKQLLAFGYNIRDFQVSGGPAWINTTRYNVEAGPNARLKPPTNSAR